MKDNSIDELLEEGVIDASTAEKIKEYWLQKRGDKANRLPIIFSFFGALLAGLGIMLLVAHNWDGFSRNIRTVIAFVPMLLGHVAAWYALKKKPENRAWTEGSAVFLLLALGACLAMVSQIYHIEGELEDFLFTWILLAIPILFVMDSAIAALLYGIGISWYAVETGYNYRSDEAPWYYLLFMGILLAYYFWIRKSRPSSNYQYFLDWLIPISLAICLETFYQQHPGDTWVTYMILFVLLYAIGKWAFPSNKKIATNGWLVVGLCGSIFVLLAQSFLDSWSDSLLISLKAGQNISWITISVFLWLSLVGVFLYFGRKKPELFRHPLLYVGLLYPFISFLGEYSFLVNTILINLFLLAIGLYYIWYGTQKDHLGILNFGMMVIAILAACRFFDTEMTFALRGVLFLVVGVSFFLANNYLLTQRKSQSNLDEN